MNKNIKEVIILVLIILLTPLLFAIFNLKEIEVSPIIYLLSMIIFCFLAGYLGAKSCKKKRYRYGLILGSSIVLTMFILTLLLHSPLNMMMIIYYLILIMSTMLGSMLNIKKR